jgi:S-adenosylmethionine decarboxylase
MHFGEHITIDGYGGSYKLLNDKELIEKAFTELLQLLKMHALSDVLIVEAPDNHIKDPGGWSGFVIIAESHITMHTFPKRRFISADVYTCQNGLDTQLITDYFKNTFQLEEVETNFIVRGKKYPEHNLV